METKIRGKMAAFRGQQYKILSFGSKWEKKYEHDIPDQRDYQTAGE